MSTSKDPTACVLIIGNEILSGRTKDVNLNFIANRLTELGIRLSEARVIPDLSHAIVDTVNQCRARYNYVFTTGGIGPTHDDITAVCIAKAFGVPLVRHQPSVEKMEHYYGDKLNAARLKMADLPEGSEPIETRVTSAPGFRIENVYVLAGVPSIAQAMFDSVAPSLAHGAPVVSRYVEAHMGEGDLADALTEIQNAFPAVDLGSYPFFRTGRIGLSVVVKGTDVDAIDGAIEQVVKAVEALDQTYSVDAVLEA